MEQGNQIEATSPDKLVNSWLNLMAIMYMIAITRLTAIKWISLYSLIYENDVFLINYSNPPLKNIWEYFFIVMKKAQNLSYKNIDSIALHTQKLTIEQKIIRLLTSNLLVKVYSPSKIFSAFTFRKSTRTCLMTRVLLTTLKIV